MVPSEGRKVPANGPHVTHTAAGKSHLFPDERNHKVNHLQATSIQASRSNPCRLSGAVSLLSTILDHTYMAWTTAPQARDSVPQAMVRRPPMRGIPSLGCARTRPACILSCREYLLKASWPELSCEVSARHSHAFICAR